MIGFRPNAMSIESICDFDVSDLINARVHLGHRVGAIKPGMERYVYGEKNGIHIIDVRQTIAGLKAALEVFYKAGKFGRKVLFVCTDERISNIIKESAEKCGQHYATKWLGGMLTNWYTVSKSIKMIASYDAIISNPESTFNKKELALINKRREKLLSRFGGMLNMKSRPDVVFITNMSTDYVAAQEAKALNIPVVAITDTNADLSLVDYAIPGNDDCLEAAQFYCNKICNAVLLGVRDEMKESGIDIDKLLHNNSSLEESSDSE